MSDEMRECPFCGGKAHRVDIPTVGTDIGNDPNAGGSYIECTKCNACTAIHFGRKENLYDSWNARPTAAPDEKLATDIAGIIEGYKYEQWTDDRAMEMARHIIEFTALRHPQQPADWRPIESVPDVPVGDHREFILAWESLKDGKRYSGSAAYLNQVEPEMGGWQSDDETFTGWFENKADRDYDEYYIPFENENIRLIAWTEIPAPPAEENRK